VQVFFGHSKRILGPSIPKSQPIIHKPDLSFDLSEVYIDDAAAQIADYLGADQVRVLRSNSASAPWDLERPEGNVYTVRESLDRLTDGAFNEDAPLRRVHVGNVTYTNEKEGKVIVGDSRYVWGQVMPDRFRLYVEPVLDN